MWRILTTASLELATVLFLLCDRAHARCLNSTRGKNTGGSCTFERGRCGWNDTDDKDDLDWERIDRTSYGQNSYIRINMAQASAGSAAHLYSPWLCATGSDALGSLTFRYAIQKSDRCRLSVHVVTPRYRKETWATTDGTGIPFSSVHPIRVKCSLLPFQIVFVGQKLSNESCGQIYDEIVVDDIVYTNVSVESTSYHSCGPLPSEISTTEDTTSASLVTSSAINNKTDQDMTQDEDSGGAGTAVGILLVFIIIAVVIAVIIYIRRQRKKKAESGQRDQEPLAEARSVTNCIYMVGAAEPEIDTVAGLINPTGENSEAVYHEIVEESARSSAIYSVPNDPEVPPPASPPDPSVDGAHSSKVGVESVAMSTGKAHSTTAKIHAALSRDSTTSRRYDRLNRHAADRHVVGDTEGEHTYDHLEDRQQGASVYETLGAGDNSFPRQSGEEEGVQRTLQAHQGTESSPNGTQSSPEGTQPSAEGTQLSPTSSITKKSEYIDMSRGSRHVSTDQAASSACHEHKSSPYCNL